MPNRPDMLSFDDAPQELANGFLAAIAEVVRKCELDCCTSVKIRIVCSRAMAAVVRQYQGGKWSNLCGGGSLRTNTSKIRDIPITCPSLAPDNVGQTVPWGLQLPSGGQLGDNKPTGATAELLSMPEVRDAAKNALRR